MAKKTGLIFELELGETGKNLTEVEFRLKAVREELKRMPPTGRPMPS